MLSQTAQYALRTAVLLARDPSAYVPAAQLARESGVPLPYLAKLLGALGRAGLVESRRGPGGGARLAFEPGSLSALDVVEAVEPLPRIQTCPLGRADHGARLCHLHRRIDEATQSLQRSLAGVTLASLVNSPPQSDSCPFPAGGSANLS